jgi:hypothetical protein
LIRGPEVVSVLNFPVDLVLLCAVEAFAERDRLAAGAALWPDCLALG